MFSLLIKNGTVVDGSGAPSYQADLGVENGKIVAIGDLSEQSAKEMIDATGKLVTPGFIDIHRHADAAAFRSDFGKAELSQGLTAVINGNCGLSLAPLEGEHAASVLSYMNPIIGNVDSSVPANSMKDYLNAVDGKAINCGMLVGAGSVRAGLCGLEKDVLDDEDYPKINAVIEKALSDGAFGVSMGIGYAPDCFYEAKDMARAIAPLKDTDIPFTVHVRNEGDGLIESFEEMLSVAKILHCPVEISHLKGMGKDNWGKAVPEVLRRIDQYRQEGIDVRCDFYPYTAGSTQLLHIMPPDTLVGGVEGWKKRLGDPAYREELRKRFTYDTSFENIVKLSTWEGILATSANLPKNQEILGKSLFEIGKLWNMDPLDACCQLLIEENGEVAMIDFIAAEEDISTIARYPLSSVISDAIYPSTGKVHPRLYGSFVHFLEQQVKTQKAVSLETGIAKMSSLPASALRIQGKGLLKEGMDADINIFALENLHENGTYQDPAQLCTGMDYVVVNGNIALDHGTFKNMTSGKGLKRC